MTDSKRDALILLKFVRETGSRSPLCHPLFSLIIVLLKGPSISLGAFGANNRNYVQIKKIKSTAMIKIYLLNASENFASFLVESP